MLNDLEKLHLIVKTYVTFKHLKTSLVVSLKSDKIDIILVVPSLQ